MYAVIESNGKQYKVKEGDVLRLDRVASDGSGKIVFDRVVLAHDGKELIVGSPHVKQAKVTAKVMREVKGDKIVAFRYKPKKRVRKKHGHRQPLTELRIEKISL